jgi:cytochrome c oxidase subunit 2
MWWWRVAYLDAAGREPVQDANEIHIPVGRPVALELESTDVIHSFWVPRLGWQAGHDPGPPEHLRLQADEPGAYGGQCAEYCGGAARPDGPRRRRSRRLSSQAWRERQASPAGRRPACGARKCSRLRLRRLPHGPGHVGQRSGRPRPDPCRRPSHPRRRHVCPTIRARWWLDRRQPVAIKPGNRMPAYPVLSGQDLRAVSAYLDSLK